MKKELSALLALSSTPKSIQINQAFRIDAVPVDEFDLAISTRPPYRMHLELIYTLAHDKMLFKSEVLEGTTPDELIPEVASKMRAILSEVAERLTTAWTNGYIFGEIKEGTQVIGSMNKEE